MSLLAVHTFECGILTVSPEVSAFAALGADLVFLAVSTVMVEAIAAEALGDFDIFFQFDVLGWDYLFSNFDALGFEFGGFLWGGAGYFYHLESWDLFYVLYVHIVEMTDSLG